MCCQGCSGRFRICPVPYADGELESALKSTPDAGERTHRSLCRTALAGHESCRTHHPAREVAAVGGAGFGLGVATGLGLGASCCGSGGSASRFSSTWSVLPVSCEGVVLAELVEGCGVGVDFVSAPLVGFAGSSFFPPSLRFLATSSCSH